METIEKKNETIVTLVKALIDKMDTKGAVVIGTFAGIGIVICGFAAMTLNHLYGK